MNLEEITWVDSGTSWGNIWYSAEELIRRADNWSGESTTVGYLLHENDSTVLLAQTVDGETDKVANVFLIYKACIVKRRIL